MNTIKYMTKYIKTWFKSESVFCICSEYTLHLTSLKIQKVIPRGKVQQEDKRRGNKF